MNFVLSYVPKASQQIRKFAPSNIIPRTSTAIKRLGSTGKGTDSENNPDAPTSETVPTSATAPSTETTATTSENQPDATTEPAQPESTWWNRWWR